MFALNIMKGTWDCSHTDDIKRCARCNLIFCGVCNCLAAKKRPSSPNRLISYCPECGEVVTINLNPDSINVETAICL